MYKKLVVLFFIWVTCFTCRAQLVTRIGSGSDTTYLISAKHFTGVIFPASYVNNIEEDKRFTPVKGEINEAEIALNKIWDKVNLYGKSKYARNILVNVTPYFANYKRQYFGYKNDHNQKVIFINLLNFADKKEANKYLSNWKSKFIVGFDGFYEHNTAGFSFNLATKEIVAGAY